MQTAAWGTVLKTAAYAVVALMGGAVAYAAAISLAYWPGIGV